MFITFRSIVSQVSKLEIEVGSSQVYKRIPVHWEKRPQRKIFRFILDIAKKATMLLFQCVWICIWDACFHIKSAKRYYFRFDAYKCAKNWLRLVSIIKPSQFLVLRCRIFLGLKTERKKIDRLKMEWFFFLRDQDLSKFMRLKTDVHKRSSTKIL